MKNILWVSSSHYIGPRLLTPVLVGNQLDAQFLLYYFYLNPLHVSSNYVLILKRSARPRQTALLPPRSNGKTEAATAVVELLMMGMRMPKTR